MGYFDGLTDAVFKKDSSDNTLFYPWGIFGSGFVIDSEEKKNQIRGFIKKMYIVLLPVIIIIQGTVGYWLYWVLLPVYFVWYIFMIKKITKDLPKSTEKLKISEAYKNSAKSHNLPTLIILLFFSLGSVAISIWVLQSGKGSLVTYTPMGFFGLCSVVFGYMIVVKIKNK